MIEKELTPVERFAVAFLERTEEQFSEKAILEAEVSKLCIVHLNMSVKTVILMSNVC